MLRGSDDILSFCEKKLAIQVGGISKDKMFSLSRVECLGACVNAPVVKINENYYEDLDLNSTDKLINNISNKKIKIGSQSGRKGSEPRKSYMIKKDNIIFKNLYGSDDPFLKSALKRGDWKDIKKLKKNPKIL